MKIFIMTFYLSLNSLSLFAMTCETHYKDHAALLEGRVDEETKEWLRTSAPEAREWFILSSANLSVIPYNEGPQGHNFRTTEEWRSARTEYVKKIRAADNEMLVQLLKKHNIATSDAATTFVFGVFIVALKPSEIYALIKDDQGGLIKRIVFNRPLSLSHAP